MGQWLERAMFFVCAALAIVQCIGFIWCTVERRRKWRAAPELWGLDWLDIVYRVEREFSITLVGADFGGWARDARVELTAGQLWELVVAKVRAADTAVPADGWPRLVTNLSEALNVKPQHVNPDSRLCADLGLILGWE
jgi:hypothetical protein